MDFLDLWYIDAFTSFDSWDTVEAYNILDQQKFDSMIRDERLYLGFDVSKRFTFGQAFGPG